MTSSLRRPSSPKQRPARPSATTSRSSWYRYYAGYSADFVSDITLRLRDGHLFQPADLVADPWNGSGTTTQVADEQAIRSWGGDVNPAMVVVAKARLLRSNIKPSELSIGDGILRAAEDQANSSLIEDDPLRAWFKQTSCTHLRSIEQAIAALLDPGSKQASPLTAASRVSSFSPVAAFFYLALFRTTRELVVPFTSSNPTWIKRPMNGQEKVSPSAKTIRELFRRHVREMSGIDKPLLLDLSNRSYDDHPNNTEQEHTPIPTEGWAQIEVASSTSLPLKDNVASAVVSSPPYCTRIDYAVATAPELATLGLNDEQFRSLRDSMIGTSTIVEGDVIANAVWGKTCRRFLKRVKAHPSKASGGYYLKSHLQYYDGLANSLAEIDRVLKKRAPCILVVQDSYYKEIHNDLATIVEEMGQELGWTSNERHDYPLSQVMSRMHKSGRKYRKSTNATETVLVFTTG